MSFALYVMHDFAKLFAELEHEYLDEEPEEEDDDGGRSSTYHSLSACGTHTIYFFREEVICPYEA